VICGRVVYERSQIARVLLSNLLRSPRKCQFLLEEGFWPQMFKVKSRPKIGMTSIVRQPIPSCMYIVCIKQDQAGIYPLFRLTEFSSDIS
jgi:hypothetical protein